MKVNIYKYHSYKEFMLKLFDDDSLGKSQRTHLAKYLNCQTGLISQVINGDRHFSYEHMIEITKFYEFTEEETEFFMLLGQYDRAGSKNLREHFEGQLNKRRMGRQRIPLQETRELSPHNLALYHSKWFNHAIHVLMELNPKPGIDEIANILKIGIDKVENSIEFLQSVGALELSDDGFRVNEINNSVGRGSPWVDGIHKDFRLEAIRSLDRRKIDDSHYSRFFVASQKRAALIQEELAEFVQKVTAHTARPDESRDGKLFAFSLDCFRYE